MREEFPVGRNFYMVRHGQTVDNVKNIVSGYASDTKLTELGKQQAIALQDVVSKLDPPVTKVITSEMSRTIKTAELICKASALRKLPITQDIGINERIYGEAEGMLEKDRMALKKKNGSIPGEELKEVLRVRTIRAVAETLKDKKAVPLFVTHGGNIRRIIENTLGIDISFQSIPNCSLFEFIAPKEKGDKWKVNVVGLGDNKQLTRQPFAEIKPIARAMRSIRSSAPRELGKSL